MVIYGRHIDVICHDLTWHLSLHHSSGNGVLAACGDEQVFHTFGFFKGPSEELRIKIPGPVNIVCRYFEMNNCRHFLLPFAIILKLKKHTTSRIIVKFVASEQNWQ